jgi:hypothetical protein
MLALGLLGACRKESAPAAPFDAGRPEMPDANFVLFVINASQSSRNVDIQVHIDGKLQINETFSSEQEEPKISISRHKVFYFRLPPGTHTLKASLASGGGILEERVELNGKRWALLMYGDESAPPSQPPPQPFKLTIQDTPIYFE